MKTVQFILVGTKVGLKRTFCSLHGYNLFNQYSVDSINRKGNALNQVPSYTHYKHQCGAFTCLMLRKATFRVGDICSSCIMLQFALMRISGPIKQKFIENICNQIGQRAVPENCHVLILLGLTFRLPSAVSLTRLHVPQK